jgi:Cuticle protein
LLIVLLYQFAVALIAFFAVAQGSAVWPYASWPYGSPYVSAPIAQIASVPAYAHAAPVSWASHVSAVHPAAIQVAGHPAIYGHPGVYGHPAVVAVPKVAATYTAATRGAVHTAPLEGHAISRSNLNLAAAPGTL